MVGGIPSTESVTEIVNFESGRTYCEEIDNKAFRRARAARAVAPLAVYSAAKYDETMTAARKRASVMLGL